MTTASSSTAMDSNHSAMTAGWTFPLRIHPGNFTAIIFTPYPARTPTCERAGDATPPRGGCA